jgi:2-oxoglutarate ferredoxin oxidoreductase subunit alpha
LVVAFNFSRFVKYAVATREQGCGSATCARSLWPFPSRAVAQAAAAAKALAVFELNAGQMIEDVQLAVLGRVPVHAIGGISHDHSGFGVGPALTVENILARMRDVYPRAAA